MDTDRLKYFCTIVDTGSLTKASEFLGVSHSGLSKAMSVLQEELGYKILAPKGRGLELTERGKSLYEQSRKIIEMVGSLKNQTGLATHLLKIGMPEVLALVVSGSLAQELKSGVSIEDLDSGEIESCVLDRKIDFAFTFVPFPHRELEHLKMSTMTLSSFCKAGAFRGCDPDLVPYVIPSTELKDNPLSLRIRDSWNSKLARLTPYRANSISIAIKMAQAGVCAIYAPGVLIRQLNEFESKNHQMVDLELSPQRRIEERTNRDIFLVKRSADDESKAMKAVSKIIRQLCK